MSIRSDFFRSKPASGTGDPVAGGGGEGVVAGVPQQRYWRRVRRFTLQLLAVWGGVTFVACWFAKELNGWHIAGFPFGFWMSAEGAIVVYVLLIAVYAWVMDRWEAALAQESSAGPVCGAQDPPADVAHG